MIYIERPRLKVQLVCRLITVVLATHDYSVVFIALLSPRSNVSKTYGTFCEAISGNGNRGSLFTWG